MKKSSIVTIILSILLSVCISWVFIYFQMPKKQAYIENFKLYESFEAKKQLEEKLINTKAANKMRLDSLKLLITDQQTELYYRQQKAIIEKEEEQLAVKYNTQIWNQLNDYIKEYGIANGYEFIHGATGSGSMMYANEKLNITDEVIKYANQKYEGY